MIPPRTAASVEPPPGALSGVLYGVAAYGWWGFVAIYFKLVAAVDPLEVLAHRIVWSVAVLLIMIAALGRWRSIAAVLRSGRALLWLAASTVLIAVNWYVFIWAVSHGRIVEASLGYFINPLVSVLLGFFFLGERLRRGEWVGVGLAALGVGWLTFGAGVFPSISLLLAFSFGGYGLVRKLAGVGPIEGLTIETALLLPLAAGWLLWRAHDGTAAFGEVSVGLDLLLLASGPVTALPLLWFAAAVRRLRLATIGLLQYIAPTIQFILAVAVYGEPFGGPRLVAFALIWIAIAIYSADNVRARRGRLALTRGAHVDPP
ncbi:MAG TPA: EamA family transporter RarD [Thermoanaerobaculia bacterium]|nr:EamA family transporter RarD [Thermoanaerobaculia bacterium]